MKCAQLAQHGDLLDQFDARVRVLGRLDLLRPDVLAAVNRLVQLTSQNGDRILNVCFPYTSRDEITTAIRDTVTEYSKPIERSLQTEGAKKVMPQDAASWNGRSGSGSRSLGPDKHGIVDSSHSTTTATAISTASQDASPTHQRRKSSSSSATFISPETINSKTLTDHMFTSGNPPVDLLIRTSSVDRLSDFMLWQCHEDTEIVFLDVMWPEFDLWHFLPVLLRWQRRVTKARKNENAESTTPNGFFVASTSSADGHHANGRNNKFKSS